MSSRERQEQRKKDFKKGIDADDARKKREEVSVTIRKSKREESLLKKRNLNAQLNDKKVVDAGVAQKVIFYLVLLLVRRILKKLPFTFRNLIKISNHLLLHCIYETNLVII
jgi:hypothetical protein